MGPTHVSMHVASQWSPLPRAPGVRPGFLVEGGKWSGLTPSLTRDAGPERGRVLVGSLGRGGAELGPRLLHSISCLLGLSDAGARPDCPAARRAIGQGFWWPRGGLSSVPRALEGCRTCLGWGEPTVGPFLSPEPVDPRLYPLSCRRALGSEYLRPLQFICSFLTPKVMVLAGGSLGDD